MGPETSPQVRASLAAAIKGRAWVVPGQWVLLLGAAAVAYMLKGLWVDIETTLVGSFPKHPFFAGAATLLGCLFVFHCVRSAKLTSHKKAYFGYRAVLLLLSLGAVVASLRPFFEGSLFLASHLFWPESGAAEAAPDESVLWPALVFLGEGIALIGLAAAGIRFVFDWQVRYWLFFLEFSGGLLALLLILLLPLILAYVQARFAAAATKGVASAFS